MKHVLELAFDALLFYDALKQCHLRVRWAELSPFEVDTELLLEAKADDQEVVNMLRLIDQICPDDVDSELALPSPRHLPYFRPIRVFLQSPLDFIEAMSLAVFWIQVIDLMTNEEFVSLIVDLLHEFIIGFADLSFLRVKLTLHVSFHLFQLTVKCLSKAHRVNDVSHVLVGSD